jgi:hypothetical protein
MTRKPAVRRAHRPGRSSALARTLRAARLSPTEALRTA